VIAAAQPVDEKPRWHPLVELRQGNLRTVGWKLLRHVATRRDVECLRRLLPGVAVTREDVESLLAELRDSPELHGALATEPARRWFSQPGRRNGDASVEHILGLNGPGRGRALFLYVATRLARPKVVVETGCFTGLDSACLLQALTANGEGHLYTIDLPAEEGRFSQVGPGGALPPDLSPGFLVPDSLRSRWTLIVGDARRELAPLLEGLGEVGLFFHDSHHSYSHMMWEFTTAWPYLARPGLLVSDDISWNTAFWDFASGVGGSLVIHRGCPNVGAVSRNEGVAMPIVGRRR
jgi:hypothetical protein